MISLTSHLVWRVSTKAWDYFHVIVCVPGCVTRQKPNSVVSQCLGLTDPVAGQAGSLYYRREWPTNKHTHTHTALTRQGQRKPSWLPKIWFWFLPLWSSITSGKSTINAHRATIITSQFGLEELVREGLCNLIFSDRLLASPAHYHESILHSRLTIRVSRCGFHYWILMS